MKIIGIIPARMESTRLPGKPLIKLGNKSMIQRVYESAIKCRQLNDLFVATPNDEIYDHVSNFGKAILTSNNPINGTERVYEAYKKIDHKYDFIINIQGDEPFIKSNQIDDLIKICKYPNEICTLVKEEKYSKKLENNSIMKVVKDLNDEALYFSRSLIPFNNKNNLYNKHICIYAYTPSILDKIISIEPSPLEIAESLEQLRWLENGLKIKIKTTKYDSFSIDTKDDLIYANKKYI